MQTTFYFPVFTLFIVSLISASKPATCEGVFVISIEETRALVHRIYEESNKGKRTAMANMDADIAADVIYHGSGA